MRQQLAKPNLMRMIDRLGSFDPCAKPSANDCYLRIPAGWNRRDLQFHTELLAEEIGDIGLVVNDED